MNREHLANYPRKNVLDSALGIKGSPLIDTGNFPKNGYDQVALCLPYASSVHFKVNVGNAEGKKEKADWSRLIGMFAKSGSAGRKSGCV